MPHEGYADPVTNNRTRFHSNIPVRELTERVTRAIEASDVSLAPLVAETMDGVTHKTQLTPTKPNGAQGLKTPNASTVFGSMAPTRLIPRHARCLDP